MCICVPILRMGRKVSRQKKLITVLKEIFGNIVYLVYVLAQLMN